MTALLADDWTTKPEDQWTVFDKIDAAEFHIDHIAKRIADIKGKDGKIVLGEPACAEGCATCSIGCAMAQFGLKWWKRELTSLTCGGTVQ